MVQAGRVSFVYLVAMVLVGTSRATEGSNAGVCVSEVSADGSCTEVPRSNEEAARLEESASEGKSRFSVLNGLAKLFDRSKGIEIMLPQDPKADQDKRKADLAKKQELYRWTNESIPVGAPFLDGKPPDDELPSVGWVTKIVPSVIKILTGLARGTVGASEIVDAISDPERAEDFGKRIQELLTANRKVNERPVDIEDFQELHQFPIDTPESVVDYEDDDAFARLRLQGANCVVLEKCTEATRKKLRVLDEDKDYAAMKEKVDSLMKAGKLFVVDHEIIKDHKPSPLDGEVERYLHPSVALFEVVDDDLLPIKAIGIQLSQGETATPIFTPADGYNWMIAKAVFEAADNIIHEVVSHLGKTHVVLESPMVAINRQLHKDHPVYRLLKPHLEGTAFINWAASISLLKPGGNVDRLLANAVEDAHSLAVQEVVKQISKDFSPAEDLKRRGITEDDFPGRYPYREYSLRYWDAIYTWVKEYLEIYYTSEEDVEKDYELKAFVDEMVEVGLFTWLREFYTTEDKRGLLIKVVATLIYTASVQHAALNFPQKTSMSYAPSCPGSIYQPAPLDKKKRTFEDYLAYLPPLEIATVQSFVLTLLGSVFHTSLGDYEADYFEDKRVTKPLSKFQENLADIEMYISERNAYVVAEWRKRGKDTPKALNFGYTTILPKNIPQSTNI